jgi:hypothetical protein
VRPTSSASSVPPPSSSSVNPSIDRPAIRARPGGPSTVASSVNARAVGTARHFNLENPLLNLETNVERTPPGEMFAVFSRFMTRRETPTGKPL